MYEEIYRNGLKVGEVHYPEGIWNKEEILALELLRQRYLHTQDQQELPPILYRLEFLRHLVKLGVYDDDTSVEDLTNGGNSGTLVGEHVG